MKQTSDLPNLGDDNFEGFDPDITLNEQAELLPYNPEYEFPKERLKLHTQLGIGAYGVVMKATATGINVHEETTTVAVKIVKNKDNDDSMRALLSELKIMVHLGRHLNVVNLLGAVTKNIAKHKLMVIVEYCRFGNLRDYLKKHRARFMDQIGRREDEIVLSNGTDTSSDIQKRLLLNSDDPSEPQTPSRSINSTDLIYWAAQVASGMNYLASRNVMHGDLAARNILLCDDNVVKICDFGLARTIYRQNVYKNMGKAILPFKWLAIECIADNVFTKRSDVWSYGIVLWELFSLGENPYPRLESNNELYRMLRDGYRMEKPQFANQVIYDIMLNCWADDPHSRPSFKDLRCRFSAMMPKEMLDRLLRLNEPYLAVNAAALLRASLSEVRTSCAQDYMNVKNSPEDLASGTPHGDSNQKQDTKLDADRSASSNSLEQTQMSWNFVDPAKNALVEPGYMCMKNVRKTHRSIPSIDNTQPSNSRMRHNNKAKLVIQNPSTYSRSSYIEMKPVDKEN